MIKRILVPLDGSKLAEGALPSAEALATRLEGELHLASIVSDVPPAPFVAEGTNFLQRWLEDEEERARTYLERIGSNVETRSPGLQVTGHVRIGPVSRTLQQLAEDTDVELVVMTTHGRGAFQRTWLGSIADQLLRRLSVPLLVLRTPMDGAPPIGGERRDPLRVLVPLDGSRAAERVLDVAPSVIGPWESTSPLLASVIDEGFPLVSVYLPDVISGEADFEERKDRAGAYLEAVAQRLVESGTGGVETRIIVDDDAAHGLLELCDEGSIDLIALSTHGRGGFSRFFLGSVADKIVRGARLPILVTRRPPDEDS